MRSQDDLTFMQCLMMPPSPATPSRPPKKTCKREAPRAHLRLDLPFDQALEQLTARVAAGPPSAPTSTLAERPAKLRRPASSSQTRIRGGAVQQKRARSAVGCPPSPRQVPVQGKSFNNPFGQWTRMPPHLVGATFTSSSSSSPKREAWVGNDAQKPEETGEKGTSADNERDELDVLRPRLYPRSKRGTIGSKPRINQARSASRSKQKSFAQSLARRGSDNSSVSGLSSNGLSRRTSENGMLAASGEDRQSTKGSVKPSHSKGTPMAPIVGQSFEVPDLPQPVEEENRAKDFTEQSLSAKLRLPLEVTKQAADCFKNHAECEPWDRADLWRLRRSDFEKVLCELCSVGGVGELPNHFVSQVFRLADMTRSGDLNMEEFISWYATFSFSEELLLGKSTKSIRDVARRMGINLLDIEGYKKIFDSYDTNKSGVIEMSEFHQMLHRVLKVPAGHHLPNSQVKSFWNMADRNGNGVIDFPEFCKFYLRHLRKNGGEAFQLSDMYRGIRNVSVRRRVSGQDA